ncbi:hypothetical protein ABZT47_00210 [Sphaerisporangium sp. NPDC005289]|uniref:hypothetical protein n=1 Tax=Sphaerisporangium sp. NPDC005289 TaxID=3155247 RepID=UPI0033B73494
MAAFAGVAASGAVIVRAERRRRAYTPEEIRDRLRGRLAEASAAAPPLGNSVPAPDPRPWTVAGLRSATTRFSGRAREEFRKITGRRFP